MHKPISLQELNKECKYSKLERHPQFAIYIVRVRFILIKMWVITRAINQYDKDGNYLVCVFKNKPTFQDLKKVLPNESNVTLGKLTRGGGRQDIEEEWYFLSELKSGELYVHS